MGYDIAIYKMYMWQIIFWVANFHEKQEKLSELVSKFVTVTSTVYPVYGCGAVPKGCAQNIVDLCPHVQ